MRHWYDLLQRGLLDDEYHRHHYYNPARLRACIASGDIVEDMRLMAKLRHAHADPARAAPGT